jgi:hypothetical protein
MKALLNGFNNQTNLQMDHKRAPTHLESDMS